MMDSPYVQNQLSQEVQDCLARERMAQRDIEAEKYLGKLKA